MQPFQNLSTLKKVGEDKKIEWVHFFLHKGFRSIESLLKETSGKYCVGDEVSIKKTVIRLVFNYLNHTSKLN